jgi:hypothetical protein
MADATKGTVGADGFIEVRPPPKPRLGADACDERPGDAVMADAPCEQRGQGPGEGAAHGDYGQGDAEHDQGEHRQEEDAQHTPNEEELRGYWEAAKDLLAFAKKQGYAEDHPVRRNAQQQVDATFADWRAATPPKAVHARMGWAEEALRRARRAQSKAEQELDDLDRQYEAEREVKLRALEEARERTRERVQKLADLSQEAAEEYSGGADDVKADLLLKGTFRTLDAQVGPAVESLLGKLDQGSEQYGIVRQVLQCITTMHAALGVATGGSATDFFDLAAGDEDGAAPEGGAPPARQPVGTNGASEAEAMDTAEVRAPRWLEPKRGGEPDPASSTGAHPPRWKKNRTEDKGEGQTPTTPTAGTPGAAAATAAPGGADAAGAGSGGGPAPPTPQADPQQDDFEPRRQRIITQALAEGTDVPTDYLRQLCPEALEEWARDHLL